MKTYHAPNSGIAAYAPGRDYIVIEFKTGERYRYDSSKPGRKHVEEMKARARRTAGLTSYINQHVRDNYARKLPPVRRIDNGVRHRSLRRMSVVEIKKAIDRLSPEERAKLNKLLYGWEDDAWDLQMQADAGAGKLDTLIATAKSEIKLGRIKRFP